MTEVEIDYRIKKKNRLLWNLEEINLRDNKKKRQ